MPDRKARVKNLGFIVSLLSTHIELLVASLRAIEDFHGRSVWLTWKRRGTPRRSGNSENRSWGNAEQRRNRRPVGSFLFGIERVSQDKLDFSLIARQAENLGLIGGNQEIHDLRLLRLSVGTLFDLLAGGQDFNILEHGSGENPFRARRRTRIAGDDYVDAHPRDDKTRQTDYLINL